MQQIPDNEKYDNGKLLMHVPENKETKKNALHLYCPIVDPMDSFRPPLFLFQRRGSNTKIYNDREERFHLIMLIFNLFLLSYDSCSESVPIQREKQMTATNPLMFAIVSIQFQHKTSS